MKEEITCTIYSFDSAKGNFQIKPDNYAFKTNQLAFLNLQISKFVHKGKKKKIKYQL